MQRKQVIASLARLTGSLELAPGTPARDLRRARVQLARALVAGQPGEEIDSSLQYGEVWERPVAAVEDRELEQVALGAIDDRNRRRAAGRATLDVVAAARTSPLRHPLDPRTHASAVGMGVSETLGPFLDDAGARRWIDVIQPLRQFQLVRGAGAASALGQLPLSGIQNDPRRIRLGRGSLWLAARLFDSRSPAGAFAGVRIKRGLLTLNRAATISATQVRIPPAAVATLTVELDPPAPAEGVPPNDASTASANLPSTVTIELTPGGARVTALAPFGAQVFGSGPIALTLGADPPRYDSALRQLWISASPAPQMLTATASASNIFTPAGTSEITSAAWAIPVAETAVNLLGPADGAGAVAIMLGEGLQLTWIGQPTIQPKFVKSATLLIMPGFISFQVTVKGAEVVQRLLLWNERPTGGPPQRSTAEYTFSKGSTITFLVGPGFDAMVALNGRAVARLDRPLRADGRRVRVVSKTANLAISDTGAGPQVNLVGMSPFDADAKLMAIALENALLRVHPQEALLVIGALNGDEVPAGQLRLRFRMRSFVHTLPDPYATRRFRGDRDGDTDIGLVEARIDWPDPADPSLSFTLPAFAEGSGRFGRLGFASLLDVSTAADQLGVLIGQRQMQPLEIKGLTVHAPGERIGVFTMPEISWEPVINHPSSPPPAPIDPPHDGGASTFQVPTVHLVPISPAPLLVQLLDAIEDGSEARARITLPFGIEARIENSVGATFALNRPEFPDDLKGALQVRMQPANPASMSATFKGLARTMGDPQNGYGARILGGAPSVVDPADFFNQDFLTTVPVRRYDFCGYGASVFSDWRHGDPDHVGVIKAHFNVFVGRTAYEVIQVQSFIYAWEIRVVRTITLERLPAGSVIRFDSGWQPASDGRFNFPKASVPSSAVHPGAVLGVVNVRNIRDDGASFELDGRTWQPVRFDADALLDNGIKIVEGASGPHHIPARDVRGYLLGTNSLPTPAQVRRLLEQHPCDGPVGASVEVAGSGTILRATRIDVTGVLDGGTSIVAALRGSPVLPGEGSWSVSRRRRLPTEAPQFLDPHTPIPLIKHRTGTVWHYADPVDILRLDTDPSFEYGFVQATGTQKIQFPRPRIEPNQPSYRLPEQPRLADVGALLNATGAFPNLGAALEFVGPLVNLDVNGGGVNLHREFDVPPSVGPKTLVDFGVVVVPLVYEDENQTRSHVVVDITPGGWSIEIQRVSFPIVMTAPPLGTINDPVLRIVGDIVASSTSAPTLRNLDVVYGGALAGVQSIFANLSQLSQFLPGGPTPRLDVSFSDGQLSIRNVFTIPKLPLGLGFIRDISLDLGMTMRLSPMSLSFMAGIGSPEKPFTWLVSPLSGSGLVQVGVKDGDPAILIRAGLGVGLSIDVGIASGSASVILAIQAEIVGGNVLLQGLLTAQATVDVLGGLASASLSLTAGLGMIPSPLPPNIPSLKPLDTVTLVASAAVGIHISICWLVHVDFDGYWQFSQTIDVPALDAVLPV